MANFEDKLNFFPYGTQYHRAPTPLPDEWDGDMDEIKRAGYTHIQLRPQWRWHERTQGVCAWDDLDELFNLAQKHGLRVILKPMLECAPDYVFEDLGGTRMGVHGIPISPIAHGAFYAGGWWPCFDNPKVVAAGSKWVNELVSRYKDHPALWFYDAWNEPRSRPVMQCQCEHSIVSYRDWLKERFGSIENLNCKFGKAWGSFETLRPPVTASDFAELYLWRTWAASSVAAQVKFVYDSIKQTHPDGYVMAHVGCCGVVQDTICDTSDDILNASQVDRFGTSFPVSLHPDTPIENDDPDYISDWIRRVDPNYWCHEFYPNHGGWVCPPSPVDLNRLVWMAIAGGTAGFTYWQYRSERVGNETNGYGLRNIDGSPTDRSLVADSIAGILREHGSKLVAAKRPKSKVALMFCRKSDMISRIQSSHSWDLSTEVDMADYFYKKAIRAAHYLYNHYGEDVDYVVAGDDISAYTVLHVTAAEMIDCQTADWLREYVRGGGKLVVEFPFACRDDNTWVSLARPNNGLEDLLGCVEDDRRLISPDHLDTVTYPGAEPFEAAMWKITLKPTTGEVFANWNDGAAAGVKNRFGKGEVYSFAASLSLGFGNTWREPVCDAFTGLFEGLGLGRDVRVPEGVWLKRRLGPEGEVWFVFNVSNKRQKIELPSVPKASLYGGQFIKNGQTIDIPARETWVGVI